MKKMIFTTTFFLAAVFCSTASALTISSAIPGQSANPTTASSTPGVMINGFYQFALLLSGLLAFAIIVYGGIKYMTSAGNPSGQGDAKDWIMAALLGMVLLACAYFVLKTINPNLVNLTLPGLTPATSNSTASNAQPASCGNCQGSCNGTCPNGYYCQVSQSGGNSCLPQDDSGYGGASGGAGASGIW